MEANKRIEQLESLARWTDEAFEIPLLGYRIGYEALIGLIPGIGDIIGGLISSYIVWSASRFNLPFPILAHMILNVLIEVVLGALPIAGDLFDFVWKANRRNVGLLTAHEKFPLETAARSRRFVLTVASFAGFLMLLLGGLLLWLGSYFDWPHVRLI